jgi:uncharacterized protein YbjQ (UPF0145 family)
MWVCPDCGEEMEDQFEGACWKCANEGVEMVVSAGGVHSSVADVILSTTPFIPNHSIKKSLGVVSGEAIIGANVFSDMLASVTDVVGGRSGSYENKLRHARQIAITEMALEAKAKGGNGIVGINMNYESIRGTMLMVAVWGTAVISIPESSHSGEGAT